MIYWYVLPRMKNKRAKHGEHYVPTDVEHIANMITHGVGYIFIQDLFRFISKINGWLHFILSSYDDVLYAS